MAVTKFPEEFVPFQEGNIRKQPQKTKFDLKKTHKKFGKNSKIAQSKIC